MSGNESAGRRVLSAIHLLHRAGQCADELFALNVSIEQLTPRQYAVLASVAAADQPSQTTLVDMTGIDRSTLADIVRRLVQRGLLSRTRTRADARMYEVRLTPAGQTALDGVAESVVDVEEQLFAAIPMNERAIVRRGLEAIVNAHGPISSARVSQRAAASVES